MLHSDSYKHFEIGISRKCAILWIVLNQLLKLINFFFPIYKNPINLFDILILDISSLFILYFCTEQFVSEYIWIITIIHFRNYSRSMKMFVHPLCWKKFIILSKAPEKLTSRNLTTGINQTWCSLRKSRKSFFLTLNTRFRRCACYSLFRLHIKIDVDFQCSNHIQVYMTSSKWSLLMWCKDKCESSHKVVFFLFVMNYE